MLVAIVHLVGILSMQNLHTLGSEHHKSPARCTVRVECLDRKLLLCKRHAPLRRSPKVGLSLVAAHCDADERTQEVAKSCTAILVAVMVLLGTTSTEACAIGTDRVTWSFWPTNAVR
jgi:hypothetical protein